MTESISNAHDATVYERGRAHGIREERAAVVKWLKKQEFADATENLLARHIAIWIERGEHRDGDDE